jgi:hypothetical protein
MTESVDSLPQVPGWIMAECRRRLWEVMRAAPGRLVYVDTDSIIIKPHNGSNAFGDSFADDYGTIWYRKGAYHRLTIHGPRNLEVGYSRRISGLPLSAVETKPLEFDGTVMRSVKRSMRNGELDCVVSMSRRFVITPQDLRRGHNPDGTTYPFEIVESTTTEDDV